MTQPQTPTPIIIDTDPGVDDAFALALAANSPEAELRGITSVFGNVEEAHTTRNALRLRALLGRPDVPVARGASRPLVHEPPHRAGKVHGADGLGEQAHTLPEPGDLDSRGAVRFLADQLAATDRPITLVPVGPLTNVALLLASHPELRDSIERLVIMGGGVDGGGNTTAAAEFNFFSDPEAAHRVFSEQLPVTLLPLDLTLRCTLRPDDLEKIGGSGPVGKTLVSFTGRYRDDYLRSLGREEMAVHDALAVAEASSPGLLGTTRMRLDVDCAAGPGRGGVLIDRRREPANPQGYDVDVATGADLGQVREFILSRIASAG